MRNIIKTMQEQGRGGPIQQEIVDEEGTESDYDEEYEDEDEEEEDEGSYEGEEEMAAEYTPEKPIFGPVPPPNLAQANGTQAAPVINGVTH